MFHFSGFMLRCIVSLVLCGVLFSGSAFAQPDVLRDAAKERLDRGDLPNHLRPIAKKIAKDLPNAGVDLHTLEWDISVRESDFDPADSVVLLGGANDVEGNLIYFGSVSSGPHRGSFITKYNSEGEFIWLEFSPAQFGHINQVMSVDIDGNIYLGFQITGSDFVKRLQKYSPSGSLRWEVDFGHPNTTITGLDDILIDDDGNIYAIGNIELNGQVDIFVKRYRLDGVLVWSKNFGLGDSGVHTLPNDQAFAIDRFGHIRVGASTTVNGVTSNVVVSLNSSGEVNWSSFFPNLTDRAAGPVLDVNCNSYVVDRSGFSFIVTKIDSDGNQVYSAAVPDALSAAGATELTEGTTTPLKIIVDRDGQVHITLSAKPATNSELLIGIGQVSPDGQSVQSGVFSLPHTLPSWVASVRALGVDRFGNPYIAADHVPSASESLKSVIFKLDKDNILGDAVWSQELENQDVSQAMSIQDLFVDFGDNIYFLGFQLGSPTKSYLGKISQPYTAVPYIAKNSPDLQIHNQSLWGEFVGGVSSYTQFFQIDHADTPFDIGLGQTFSIPLLGDFGGNVDFDGSMALGMGFEATASGGAVNIDYPGDLDIAIPGSAKLVAGAPFTITSQFDANSSGNIVSDATPELSAGLKANIGVNINSGVQLVAFSDPIVNLPLVNANVGWEGLVPGLSMNVPTGSPGQWIDFGDEQNIVSGRLARPLFSSNGGIDLDTGLIRSDLKPEVFFTLRGNLTNYISTYQFGTPTIYGISSGSSSDWAIGASVNIAQAFAQIELEANQNLTFTPTVSTVYQFSPAVNIHLPGGGVLSNQTSYEIPMTLAGSTWTGSLDISVSGAALGTSNNAVTITPKSKIVSTLENRTWVDIQPLVGWETLAAEVHASAFGEELLAHDFCALCFDFPLTDDLPIDLFDSTLNMPVTEVELDPITFLVDPDGNPRISGTSRARLSAFIYDQVSADQFELAAFVNSPSKKMLIYGDNFFTAGKFPIDHFVMCSQGRVIELPTTILNSRTALVEIPNSIRLIPGIARIWAVSANPGQQGFPISESVDFPIELPRPNLGTAGPNLWAADPRLSNLAIDVIDGLTPSRTASFIARRDYWYVLADMWDAIDAGNGTGLFDSYPIYDFTAEPPMPAVLIASSEPARLDDASHTWAFDGDFMDSEGMADGVPEGGVPEFVSSGVPSYLGQAANFVSNRRIRINGPDAPSMGTSDFSFSFWAKKNSIISGSQVVFDNFNDSISSGIQIRFFLGKLYFHMNQGAGSSTTIGNIDTDQDLDWHHYAISVDRDSSSGIRIYVDGQLDVVDNPRSVQSNITNANSTIGTFAWSNGGSSLNGQLADFTMFRRAISIEEVQQLSSAVESMPIGRFRQPVENGILYSLMPKSEYDKPKLVSISLDVAGPGGGKSNSIDLTVAAPQPVVSNIIPRAIYPDYGEFVMTVEGPLSVPYFNGFEEQRFGNFNKASIVHLDGIALNTTFVTPGTLRAVVPAELTTLQGNALITVFTPSNGTGYFDSFSGDIIESGGESNGIVFAVQYPTPIITAMSPELTSKALIDRCPDNPGMVRLKITGENFWPGATIWVDGVEFVTEVQTTKGNGLITRGIADVDLSYNVIYTDLNIADLSRYYSAPVVVMNPDGSISDRVFLDIVDEATYEAYYGVKLPPQMLPGECK